MRNIAQSIVFFLVGLAAGGAGVHFGARRLGLAAAEDVITRPRVAPGEGDDLVLKDPEVERLVAELKGWREKRDTEWQKIEQEKSGLAQERAAVEEAEIRVEALRSSLMRQTVQTRENQQRNFKRLGAIYGKMEPATAAQLLSGLPEQDAARLLYSMEERDAAQLLSTYASLGEDQRSAAVKLTETIKHLAPQTASPGRKK